MSLHSLMPRHTFSSIYHVVCRTLLIQLGQVDLTCLNEVNIRWWDTNGSMLVISWWLSGTSSNRVVGRGSSRLWFGYSYSFDRSYGWIDRDSRYRVNSYRRCIIDRRRDSWYNRRGAGLVNNRSIISMCRLDGVCSQTTSIVFQW